MQYSETHRNPAPCSFDDEGLSYLDKRWIEQTTAISVRISATGGYVWFPYSVNGEIIRWKARSIVDKKRQFWTALPEEQKSSWKAPFFNQIEPYDTKYLIITEGEFDCLALIQLGAVNCVSLPNGAAAVEAAIRDNYRYLQKFKEIYIAFDMDEAGKKAAEKAMQMLPPSQVRRISFPAGETEPKDANDWMIDTCAKPDDLARLMLSALRPSCERITPLSDVSSDIFNELDIGCPSGFKKLDAILGGMRKGELTVVSAETGCGKTTFCMNLGVNLLRENKIIWINSFEMHLKTIIRKLASNILNKNFRTRDFEEQEKLEFQLWTIKNKIYLNSTNKGSSIQDLRKDFELAALAYQVDFIILDHLDYIYSANIKKNSLEMLDECIRELHNLALEFNVGIILVAHPRQIQGPVRALTINDLKGSSAIKQYADNIFLLTRLDTLDPTQLNKVKLSVVKNRLFGKQGCVNLDYNFETDTYTEEKIIPDYKLPKYMNMNRGQHDSNY